MSIFTSHETTLALLPVAALGTVLNWTIFYSTINITSYKHAFGYLSANQALADAFHSTSFLLYFCPMVLLDSKLMKHYSEYAGFFILFCYELSVLTHLIISTNRLCAVFMPFRYPKIFSEKNTKRMILFLWIFSGTIAVVFYQYLCKVFYDDAIQFINFTNSEFCANIAFYEDFLKNALLVILIVFIDIVTVVKVRKVSRKVTSNISVNNDQQRFSKREIRFLKQTLFQGAVFLFELVTYFFIPKYFTDKWVVFFATSFAWVSVHAADGLVVLLFNPDIRKFLVSAGKANHFETSHTHRSGSHPSK